MRVKDAVKALFGLKDRVNVEELVLKNLPPIRLEVEWGGGDAKIYVITFDDYQRIYIIGNDLYYEVYNWEKGYKELIPMEVWNYGEVAIYRAVLIEPDSILIGTDTKIYFRHIRYQGYISRSGLTGEGVLYLYPTEKIISIERAYHIPVWRTYLNRYDFFIEGTNIAIYDDPGSSRMVVIDLPSCKKAEAYAWNPSSGIHYLGTAYYKKGFRPFYTIENSDVGDSPVILLPVRKAEDGTPLYMPFIKWYAKDEYGWMSNHLIPSPIEELKKMFE